MCCPDHVIRIVDPDISTLCLILNIFIPGAGTILNAFADSQQRFIGVLLGILQFLTTPLMLIGWVWAIVYGVKIVNKSKYYQYNNTQLQKDNDNIA